MRRHDLELRKCAIRRFLISSPATKLRGVTKTIALHVIVSNFNHELRSQWLPRQVLSRAPTTLRTRNTVREIVTRPFFPWMIRERVFAIRVEKLNELETLLIGKTRAHTNVLQVARVVKQSQQ